MGKIRFLTLTPPKNHLPIELEYFCRALSNRLIEIYKLVHLKNSKIHVFGDFMADLGPKSIILALRRASSPSPKIEFFFKLPITLAYLCRHRSKDFSQLYKVVYLNFPPFGRKIEFDKYRRFPPPTSRQYQIMADAPIQ